jgi:hypothetical protein
VGRFPAVSPLAEYRLTALGLRRPPSPRSSAVGRREFQPLGFLDYVLDFSATKLITLKQCASDKLNLVPILLDQCMGAPLLTAQEFALAR